MFKGLWKWVNDNIIDPISGFLKPQEEIDQAISDDLSLWGAVYTDPSELPAGLKRRRNTFVSHKDAIRYIADGGIPADYCHILILPNWDNEGNDGFSVWIDES
jgi:hypothetical protein